MSQECSDDQLPAPLQTAYILQCARAYGHAFQEAVRLHGYAVAWSILRDVFADEEGGIPNGEFCQAGADPSLTVVPVDPD